VKRGMRDPRVDRDRNELDEIRRLLNGEPSIDGCPKDAPLHPLRPATQEHLLTLVQAWHAAIDAAESNFERALALHERSAERFPTAALLKMKLPPGFPTFVQIEKRCQLNLLPMGSGAQPLIRYVGERGKPWTGLDFALQKFVQLLTNPQRDKLVGPCPRCDKYFIKKRASNRVYCSTTCGSETTAIRRTREVWDEQRAKRMKKAKHLKEEWVRVKTTESFQEWAVKRTSELTKTFLTRAMNCGELGDFSQGNTAS
jgi:hypothetical protein